MNMSLVEMWRHSQNDSFCVIKWWNLNFRMEKAWTSKIFQEIILLDTQRYDISCVLGYLLLNYDFIHQSLYTVFEIKLSIIGVLINIPSDRIFIENNYIYLKLTFRGKYRGIQSEMIFRSLSFSLVSMQWNTRLSDEVHWEYTFRN